MANFIATESDDSATITDHGGATTEKDIIIEDDKKSVDLLSPQGSNSFQVGEKVLALFEKRLYKAKVWIWLRSVVQPKYEFASHIDTTTVADVHYKFTDIRAGRIFPYLCSVQKIRFSIDWEYRVHYEGWNKSWDEWVGVERLFKDTEENLQKQQELEQKHESYNNANVGGAVQRRPTAYIGSRRKKQRTDSVEVEKVSLIEKHSNTNIPPGLKALLIEDWESRTRLGKLVKLPRSPSVHEILDKYRAYRLKEGLVSVDELVKGLCCYFDVALHAMLLYNNERQQYKEAFVGNLTPSAVYGAEHLLRLIVKLPEVLHRSNIEEDMLLELHLTLADFLKFFEKCQMDFYPLAYRSGSGEVQDAISVSEEDK